MNAKLKTLLAGGSVVAVIAGIATLPFIPKVSTSKAELVDAGVRQDCTLRRIACSAYVDSGYQEREFTIATCPTNDGGPIETIWPRKAAQFREYLVDEDTGCRRLGVPADIDINEEPPEVQGSCACHNPSAGACSDDAGRILGRNEALPGTWTGPGCVRKICGELFGLYNWPNECPR